MKTSTSFFSLAISLLALTAQSSSAQGLQAFDDIISGPVFRSTITITTATDNDLPALTPKFITSTTQPEKGSVVLNANNTLVYTPSRRFKGEDAFSYRITTNADGSGDAASANIIIRNPFTLARGTYAGLFSGTPAAHANTGYLVIKNEPSGAFTCNIRYAGQAFRFRAIFDETGAYTATIVRGGSRPNLILAMQFPFEDEGEIACQLRIGSQVTPFAIPFIPWRASVRPPREGRYTMILPPPNALVTNPQGNGFGAVKIGRSGTARVSGRTGDDRPFSSSTHLAPDITMPVYAVLYRGLGSISGIIDFASGAPALVSVISSKSAILGGDLAWYKPRIARDARFAAGFNLTVAARGAQYFEPVAGQSILGVPGSIPFNSNYTVSAGNITVPRTERALLGARPDAGQYAVAFNNARVLRANIRISPRTGLLSGSFYDTSTRLVRRVSGVFIQGEENTAFGVWNSKTRAGRIELKPDAIAPAP